MSTTGNITQLPHPEKSGNLSNENAGKWLHTHTSYPDLLKEPFEGRTPFPPFIPNSVALTYQKLFTLLALCPLSGCGYFGFSYGDSGHVDSCENDQEGHKLVVDWPYGCSPKERGELCLFCEHDEIDTLPAEEKFDSEVLPAFIHHQDRFTGI